MRKKPLYLGPANEETITENASSMLLTHVWCGALSAICLLPKVPNNAYVEQVCIDVFNSLKTMESKSRTKLQKHVAAVAMQVMQQEPLQEGDVPQNNNQPIQIVDTV